MAVFAWVVGGIVVIVGLVALSDFLGGRRTSNALLRRPPQDLHEQARIQARGWHGPDGPPGAGGQ
jgi:hypothetical protein